ncbi:hypothetical protein WA026_016335 [Henosepilachna vigintioctopunctata]|uniref:Uncharacterized protein n=1 Tax=Henosepilachna vigintioctopunctata TaxID=420089 RepID=A0AAW1UEN8_9CUCU
MKSNCPGITILPGLPNTYLSFQRIHAILRQVYGRINSGGARTPALFHPVSSRHRDAARLTPSRVKQWDNVSRLQGPIGRGPRSLIYVGLTGGFMDVPLINFTVL